MFFLILFFSIICSPTMSPRMKISSMNINSTCSHSCTWNGSSTHSLPRSSNMKEFSLWFTGFSFSIKISGYFWCPSWFLVSLLHLFSLETMKMNINSNVKLIWISLNIKSLQAETTRSMIFSRSFWWEACSTNLNTICSLKFPSIVSPKHKESFTINSINGTWRFTMDLSMRNHTCERVKEEKWGTNKS